MAVDYEEGRRLLAEYNAVGHEPQWDRLAEFMVHNAEDLLNPDPWRPTSKEPSALALRNTAEIYGSHIGSQLSDHLLDAATYVEEVAAHFREVKGPGQ